MEVIGIILVTVTLLGMIVLAVFRPVRQKLREYRIEVCCYPTIKQLHYLDQQVPKKTLVEILTAEGDRAALEKALDLFHSTVPIKVLDDFDIVPTIKESWPANRKARLRLEKLATVQPEERYYHDE